MKRVCIIFLLSIIISLTALGGCGAFTKRTSQNTALAEQYLRIHIRAHSNEHSAQSVKYIVRDRVVDYLTPLVANYQTQAQALTGIQDRLGEIERVAKTALLAQGYDYGASAKITKEQFPTRVYDGYTLPAGEYTALILSLGQGKGDNWWCVVYPPLCFTESGLSGYVYRSKIYDIINDFFNKEKN